MGIIYAEQVEYMSVEQMQKTHENEIKIINEIEKLEYEYEKGTIEKNELESEIVEAMIDREAPSTVESQVNDIAKLKAEVTKIHLQCISKTTAILSDEQIEFLLPFCE